MTRFDPYETWLYLCDGCDTESGDWWPLFECEYGSARFCPRCGEFA